MSKYTATPAYFKNTATGVTGGGVCADPAVNYTAIAARVEPVFTSIMNTHPSATLYINELGPAWTVDTGYVGRALLPGDEYIWDNAVPTNALNVASPTAGATYFAVVG